MFKEIPIRTRVKAGFQKCRNFVQCFDKIALGFICFSVVHYSKIECLGAENAVPIRCLDFLNSETDFGNSKTINMYRESLKFWSSNSRANYEDRGMYGIPIRNQSVSVSKKASSFVYDPSMVQLKVYSNAVDLGRTAEIAIAHFLLGEEYIKAKQIADRSTALKILTLGYDQLNPHMSYAITFSEEEEDYTDLVKKWMPDISLENPIKMKKIAGIAVATDRDKEILQPLELDIKKPIFSDAQFSGKQIIGLWRAGIFVHSPEVRALHYQKMAEAAIRLITPGQESKTVIVGAAHSTFTIKHWAKVYGLKIAQDYTDIPLDPKVYGNTSASLLTTSAVELKTKMRETAIRVINDSLFPKKETEVISAGIMSDPSKFVQFMKQRSFFDAYSYGKNGDYFSFTIANKNHSNNPELVGHLRVDKHGQAVELDHVYLSGTFERLKDAFTITTKDGNRTGIDVLQINFEGQTVSGKKIKLRYNLPMFTGLLSVEHKFLRARNKWSPGILSFIDSLYFSLKSNKSNRSGKYRVLEDAAGRHTEMLTEELDIPVKDMMLPPDIISDSQMFDGKEFSVQFPNHVIYGENLIEDDVQSQNPRFSNPLFARNRPSNINQSSPGKVSITMSHQSFLWDRTYINLQPIWEKRNGTISTASNLSDDVALQHPSSRLGTMYKLLQVFASGGIPVTRMLENYGLREIKSH